MHKIDTDTAVNSEFTDGVPESGLPATRLNASWFNTIQRELSNIVQKAGMALSKSDDGQVFSAIFKYIKDNGISGIKKAFKFTDENTHHALDIDANGVVITQDTDTFSVFADGKKLHFDGDSIFSSNVEFAADVDCTGEINVRDGSKTILATLGKDIYAKGDVSCDGAVHSNEGMSTFDKISASGDVKVYGDLVCEKDVGAKGNVAVGGKLGVNGVVDSRFNSMPNLKIQQKGDSTDDYVSLSSGAVFATGTVTARQVVVEPIEGEGFKIEGSLRVQRSAIGLYELMFYNGSSWVKVC